MNTIKKMMIIAKFPVNAVFLWTLQILSRAIKSKEKGVFEDYEESKGQGLWLLGALRGKKGGFQGFKAATPKRA